MTARATAETGDTLHRRILAEIEGRILSGDWPPGHRIPAEHALAEQFGCSRMTINKALTQLAKAGYIERRRRAGSFVRQPQAQSAVLEIHTVETEVAAMGLPYRYALLDRRRHERVPQEHPLAPDPALELTCLHWAGATPFCLEHRLINLRAAPAAARADFTTESPGAWLLGSVPWRVAEHAIEATRADATTARHLGIPAGSPCLTIERRTWDAERVVTSVRLTYPGDRHRLVARFSPAHH